MAQSSFNSNNNVKKLRQKEKEDEKIIREQVKMVTSNCTSAFPFSIALLYRDRGHWSGLGIAFLDILVITEVSNIPNNPCPCSNPLKPHVPRRTDNMYLTASRL